MLNKIAVALVGLAMFGWITTASVEGRGGGGGGHGGGGHGGGGGGRGGAAHFSAGPRGGANFAGTRTSFSSTRANFSGTRNWNGGSFAHPSHGFNNFNHFHNGFNHGFNRGFNRSFFGFGYPFYGLGYGYGLGWPYYGYGNGYGYDNYPYYGDYGDYGYGGYPSSYYAPMSYQNGYPNGAGPYNGGFPMPANPNPYGDGFPLPPDPNATFPYNGNPKNQVPPVEPSKKPDSDPKQKTLPEGDFVRSSSTESAGHRFLAYGEQSPAKIVPAASTGQKTSVVAPTQVEQPPTKIAPAASGGQKTSVVLPTRLIYPAYGEQVPELPLLTQSKR